MCMHPTMTNHIHLRSEVLTNPFYHYLCVQRHIDRIPIVCTSKWDIMGSLVNCLMIDETQNSIQLRHEKIRQLACLILNNLSIPKENKSIMILGCHATPLLRNLTRMIRTQEPETSYLCCICLMNLSFLSDGVEPIMTFSPQSDNDAHQGMSIPSIGRNSIDSRDWENFPTSMLRPTRAPTPPRQRRSNAPSPYLDDPNSLLLSLESLMRDHQPFLMSKAYSVEGEAIRWSVGLLRNLTKKNKHCSIIAKTEIPALFLGFLDKTPHPATKWTKDTIEDMSLTALDQLAGSPDSCEKLRQIGAICIVQNIKLGASKTQVDRKISSILKSLEQ